MAQPRGTCLGEPMRKQMSGKVLTSLIDYYIACLTKEDALTVTFDLDDEGTLFSTQFFHTEAFFQSHHHQTTLNVTEESEEFFQTSLPSQKDKTLFYGYPCVICPDHTISPLFFTEVTIRKTNQTITLTIQDTTPTMNHYLLLQQGFSPEEIHHLHQRIQEQPTFTEKIISLCKLFHIKGLDFSKQLDTKPLPHTNLFQILNKTILYYGERTDYTKNLILELQSLKQKPLDELATTALYFILTGGTTQTHGSLQKPLLEIFSLNPSQDTSVSSALTNPITVITGPPGTGKSQVVLNILSNAIYQQKTILFASKNNKAVDVVFEKLNRLLPYSPIIRMGHRGHRQNAKQTLEQVLNKPLQYTSTKKGDIRSLHPLSKDITVLQEELQELITLDKTLDLLQQKIEDILKQLPLSITTVWNFQPLPLIDYCSLKKDIEHLSNGTKTPFFFLTKRTKNNQNAMLIHTFTTCCDHLPTALSTQLQAAITSDDMYLENLKYLLSLKNLDMLMNEQLSLEIKHAVSPSIPFLKRSLASKHHQRITLSRHLLEDYWSLHIHNLTQEDRHKVINYFLQSSQLQGYIGDPAKYRQVRNMQLRTFQHTLTLFPAWVVTNLSAKSSFPLKNHLFDLLIIDEASQCDIPSALPLFYRAKHIIIIGDPYQLKHVSLLDEPLDRDLAQHNQIEALFDTFSYTKHSLYDLIEHIIISSQQHPILLNEHYRCHRDIINFSNKYYYNNKLSIETDHSRLLPDDLFPHKICWHHVQGTTIPATSPYNEQEAQSLIDYLCRLYQTLQQHSFAAPSIGVVTLFRAQADLIHTILKDHPVLSTHDLAVGTAHKFQGDEKDIILFSPAVSNGIKPGTLEWIKATTQLINVAVTRARSCFIIIGDYYACSATIGPLHDLASYVLAIEK